MIRQAQMRHMEIKSMLNYGLGEALESPEKEVCT